MNGVVVAETLRRHVTSWLYLAWLAFIAIVALGTSKFGQPASAWPTLVSILAIICGAGIIGPEFSSGTLQLVLVKPVNRAVYLVSRVAGVVSAVWIAAAVGAIAELTGRALWSTAAMRPIGTVLVNSMADAILTASLLALLGSLTRAYFNVAIYAALLIGLSVSTGIAAMLRTSQNALGQFLTRYPVIEKAIGHVDRNLFPEVTPRWDRDWMLLVLANACVALVLACFAFRRREVPYGAD
jgi:ABC-type transport system involved in multi-copper enzyme maturation permease subunit